MPLYEYFCEPCDGVFELLRPTRDASLPQPCPMCDEDAKRIVSHEWSAFIHRDGYPRRLPDDGTYRHLGKKVSKPLTETIDGFRHPEINPAEREVTPPSLEELEKFEIQVQQKYEYYQNRGGNVVNSDMERAERDFKKRLVKTRGTKRVEQEKRRILDQTRMIEAQRAAERRRRAENAKRARRERQARGEIEPLKLD
jgi:putative FmdB family regulatory protein